MQHVLVTGGAGYVGTVLVQKLLQNGFQVTVLDNCPDRTASLKQSQHTSVIDGDVRDTALLEKACEPVDSVVHLASLVGYPACAASPGDAVAINRDATASLARIIDGRKPLVFASTASVYGQVQTGICNEQHPLRPQSLYARTKARAESSVLEAGGTVLRPVTACGVSPSFRWDLLLHHFVWCAVSLGKIEVYEPQAQRPLIHVEDIAHAIQLCLIQENVAGRVFNVALNGAALSKGDLANVVAERVGAKVLFRHDENDPDARNYQIASEAIFKLGFAPRHAPLDSIDALAERARERLQARTVRQAAIS